MILHHPVGRQREKAEERRIWILSQMYTKTQETKLAVLPPQIFYIHRYLPRARRESTQATTAELKYNKRDKTVCQPQDQTSTQNALLRLRVCTNLNSKGLSSRSPSATSSAKVSSTSTSAAGKFWLPFTLRDNRFQLPQDSYLDHTLLKISIERHNISSYTEKGEFE